MYQLFPSYGSFVLFSLSLLAIAILSLLFRRQLNAVEDMVRDTLEMKISERKSQSKAAKRHSNPQHARQTAPRKAVTVTISRNGNMAA